MWVRVLGPMAIMNGASSRSLGPQQSVLLAALIRELGCVVPSSRLAELLWDDGGSVGSRATLRSHVAHLRKALAPSSAEHAQELLSTVGTRAGVGYKLHLDTEQLDAACFEQLYERAMATQPHECRIEELRRALRLWHGPAFADVADRSFVMAEASRLDDLHRAARKLLAETLASSDRPDRATAELRRVLESDPLDERTRESLVTVLYELGRVDEAAAICKEGVRLLDQRGLDTSALTRLQTAVLRCELVSLRPWSVRQRGDDRSELVGRNDELRSILRSLTEVQEGRRIVTLSGAAGVGKTTLARASARAVGPAFPDGQLFVDLGTCASPGDVLAAALRSLGLGSEAVPDDYAARLGTCRSFLGARRALLILENADSEASVAPLLSVAAGSGFIVTARKGLGELIGDHVRIASLDTNDGLRLLGHFLGESRVAAEEEAAGEVVQSCDGLPLALWIAAARLAGSPGWTIERLASALANEERRLDELTTEGASIRSALEANVRVLDAPQRRAFRHLAVLNGAEVAPWELAALLDVTDSEAHRLLQQLWNAHLVRPVYAGPATIRFCVPDLVRLYASEIADDTEAEPPASEDESVAASRRLAERALALLGRATTEPDGEALAWFETQRWALVRAARHAARIGEAELAGALSSALAPYFRMSFPGHLWRSQYWRVLGSAIRAEEHWTGVPVRGSAVELRGGRLAQHGSRTAIEYFLCAIRDSERVLQHGQIADSVTVRRHHAALFVGAARVHLLQGRYRFARALFDRARVVVGEEDRATVVYATCGIGMAYVECGYQTAGEKEFVTALELAERDASAAETARALCCLGQLRHRQRLLQSAAHLYTLAAGHAEKSDSTAACSFVEVLRADLWREQGWTMLATAMLSRCLDTLSATVDSTDAATVLVMLGRARLEHGEEEAAAVALERALVTWKELGAPYWQAYCLDILADVRQQSPRRRAEAETLREEAGRLRSTLQLVSPMPTFRMPGRVEDDSFRAANPAHNT